MEARCNACEVYGGPEKPCVDVAPYANKDRPCPRVLLEADNAIAFDIVAKAGLEPAGLFNAWLPLQLECLGLTPGQRLLFVDRAIATLSHPVVVEHQEQERERARLASKSPRRG